MLFIIIGIPLFILFLPFMIILFPIHYIQRKRFEKKYANFLIENNGVNFFCYNYRKKSKKYIVQNIIPNLNEEIEIVYLNGKKVVSKYSVEFISQALYRFKKYNRFPQLMKIRNGKTD